MAVRDDTVQRARDAYDARRWDDAMAAFEEAEAEAELTLEDAERFAWCHVWTLAPSTDCIGAFEALETRALRDGAPLVAARAAMEQVRMHSMVENRVLVNACYRRALQHAGDDEATVLFLELAPALGLPLAGRFDEARAIGEALLPRAEALGDPTILSLAKWVIGHGLAYAGEIEEGLATLDDAMALAIGGSVHPLYAGLVTCGVVMACRAIGDWRRATEWTEVADRYCSRNAVCHYPGHCSVFRSELRRLDGDSAGAAEAAAAALVLNGDWSVAWAGSAHHQRGEAELCRGNLAEAQAAFAHATELGYHPQPGQAQLLLLAGDGEAAFRSISDAVDGPTLMAATERLFIVLGGVGIAIETGETEAARRWAGYLAELGDRFATDAAVAAAAHASGLVALADGDADGAVEHLRAALLRWSSAGSPLHSARARAALADALDAAGDEVQARLERHVAREAFDRIGARTDLERLDTDDAPAAVRRTLSFTDIVGSSELLAAMGDEAWTRVLRQHDTILRTALTDHAGTEVKHEGDGLFVAFDDDRRAIEWAIDVQLRLDRHRAEVGFLPDVRIGVHCGDAVAYGDDYIGRCVHETARIANAAGAGQIFVSDATLEPLGDRFPVRTRHALELKGFDEPHPVVEIDWQAR